MKFSLLLAATALLCLAFTAPPAHAVRTPKVPRRVRVAQPAGRNPSSQPATPVQVPQLAVQPPAFQPVVPRQLARGQATQMAGHRHASQPAPRGQAGQPVAPQPAPVFDPSPFRENIPPPPEVTVAYRNAPQGAPEWDWRSPSSVKLKRAKHAVQVLRARLYTASRVAAGQRADELFNGRLPGSENDAHDEGNYGGYKTPSASMGDLEWIRRELFQFWSISHMLKWEGTEEASQAKGSAALFWRISTDIANVLSDAQAPHPGLELAVSRQIYADEFILWYGAWLPHLDDTLAWLLLARSKPEAPPAPLESLATLVPTFIRPFDALCASSTFPVELLLIVRLRVRWLTVSDFLKAASAEIMSPEFDSAVAEAFRILVAHFKPGHGAPTPAATWKQLCEAEDAPLRQVLRLLQPHPTKSARKV